jgi:hypothetical protein
VRSKLYGRGKTKQHEILEARKSKEGEKETVAADKGVGAENNIYNIFRLP